MGMILWNHVALYYSKYLHAANSTQHEHVQMYVNSQKLVN